MSAALFNAQGKLLCYKPKAAKEGETIRTLSAEDVATCKAAGGRGLKWENGAVALDDIPDAACKPLSPRQFGYLMIALGVSDAQVEGLIASLISDTTARAKALVDYRKAIEFKFSHPLVSMAIAALELDAQDVKAAWLEAGRA